MGARNVGAVVKRLEDPRLLTGRGRYTDDIVLPGLAELAFVRSTEAHAAHQVHRPRRGAGAPRRRRRLDARRSRARSRRSR